jgi:uncharacterized membrane protein YraQ (UPF0718 family)
MKNFFIKNKGSIIVIVLTIVVVIVYPRIRGKILIYTARSFVNFIFMITPVFICIGLLDAWIDKEKMIRLMGKESGIRGMLTGLIFGLVTAVPIYALLPIAGVMLKKRCRIMNILLFICSSASIRLPLLLFEISYLGWRFAVTVFCLNVCIVICIALIIERALSEKDRELIYEAIDTL